MQAQAPIEPVAPETLLTLSLVELAELLIKHYSIHDGLYDATFQFQIAIGAVGPLPDKIISGAILGISRVGLLKTEILGPHTLDAAVCNPVKKEKPRKRATEH